MKPGAFDDLTFPHILGLRHLLSEPWPQCSGDNTVKRGRMVVNSSPVSRFGEKCTCFFDGEVQATPTPKHGGDTDLELVLMYS